ncbi:capsular polysaccharide phosphotransferase LcbA [Actinobacillus indolicus]|nr:capsular polysaccharide phosphotransferase LcbA [Actinobacillus indolicus]VTU07113.1 capsular polysaccharide phosphotransferase LcbA [Actinobacillus indolicus]
MSQTDIDIVLIWVDNNDPKWQEDFFYHKKDGEAINSARFRDWENLHYWFRGIEKNAPWVRKVHLVTSGHFPSWLNRTHTKLNLVSHSDYIDKKFLPTFNSHSIELNLHRIDDLSEKFIFFNDDMFLVNLTQPEDFFKNSLPRDVSILNAYSGEGISHILMNDLNIINKYFNKKTVIKNNFFKFFNFNYGVDLLRTISLLPWPRFTGFFDPHLPQPFLKSTFVEVWQKESKLLDEVTSHKFRDSQDVNQYLFRYWQLVSGNFIPNKIRDIGITYHLTDDNVDIAVKILKSEKYKMMCINDTSFFHDFEMVKRKINSALEYKFPEKSTFEI